eukprot:jgi/Ulvmu1/9372/UM050_0124.1
MVMASPNAARKRLRDMLQTLQIDNALDQVIEMPAASDGDESATQQKTGGTENMDMEQMYHMRINRLETKLAQTTATNTKLRLDLQHQRKQHNNEIEQLQSDIGKEVMKLKQRQDELESARAKAASEASLARVQLSTTSISDARYSELKQIPPDQRCMADEVKLAIHEGLQQLKQENEHLRLQVQTSQEAQQRTLKEVAALQREVSRLQAAEVTAAAERDEGQAVHAAQVQRLQREAQEAGLAAQINEAKAAQYDEMAAHAEHLEQAIKPLQGQAQARLQAEQRVAMLETELKDREHKLQLATMDSAYLKREVASLEARLQAVQQERDNAQAAAADSKARQDGVCLSILQGEGDGRAALERRIDEEVARVREAACADVATVRDESRAALERETRLLRDMRDRAQHDADLAAAEVKECRQALDDAAVRMRSTQHKADVQHSALAAEVKIMGADMDRAKMLAAEREEQARSLQAQNDMLAEKVRVLTDSLYAHAGTPAQDSDRRCGSTRSPPQRALSGRASPASEWDAGHHSPGRCEHRDQGGRGGRAGQSGAVRTMRRERDALAAQCEELREEVARATAEVARIRFAHADSSPTAFLTQELRHTVVRAEAAAEVTRAAHAQMQAQAAELKAYKKRLRAVQGDLHSVLEQRRSFDSLLEKANSRVPSEQQH